MKHSKIITGMLLLAMLLVWLIPSAMDSAEEQQPNLTKDAAQLKIEALEAELGEEGMKEVADYLELQASLPDTVKVMPYRALAFAGTQEESRSVTFKYIDGFNVSEKEKDRYKAGIKDIWDRYPDKITKDDYEFMSEIGSMLVNESLKNYESVPVK
ncbi:MAG: hypothetical protein QM426_02705 [Euryarchaeota archaeon]|nr:hypothetical protein [Euryarchaeota archaeon]